MSFILDKEYVRSITSTMPRAKMYISDNVIEEFYKVRLVYYSKRKTMVKIGQNVIAGESLIASF